MYQLKRKILNEVVNLDFVVDEGQINVYKKEDMNLYPLESNNFNGFVFDNVSSLISELRSFDSLNEEGFLNPNGYKNLIKIRFELDNLVIRDTHFGEDSNVLSTQLFTFKIVYSEEEGKDYLVLVNFESLNEKNRLFHYVNNNIFERLLK